LRANLTNDYYAALPKLLATKEAQFLDVVCRTLMPAICTSQSASGIQAFMTKYFGTSSRPDYQSTQKRIPRGQPLRRHPQQSGGDAVIAVVRNSRADGVFVSWSGFSFPQIDLAITRSEDLPFHGRSFYSSVNSLFQYAE